MKKFILFISLLLFMTGCAIDGKDEKDKFITKNTGIESKHLSCQLDTDCKVITVHYCCQKSFTSVNLSYTGEIHYPLDCRNIDCEPPKYQPTIEEYESFCEENICKTQVK